MEKPIKVKPGYKFLVEQSDFSDQIGQLYTVKEVINTYESSRGVESVFSLVEIPTTFDTFCGKFYKEIRK